MFESAVMEMQGQQSARRWLSLPVAVGFHLVAVAGICLGQYAQIDRVVAREDNVVFFVEAPLPELREAEPRVATGPSRPVEPASGPARPSAPASPGPVQPREDQDARPALPDRLDLASEGRGDPRNNGSFVVELTGPFGPGGPGGPGTEIRPGGGDPQAADVQGDIVYRPGNGVSRPEILSRVEPRYSEAARRARVQGRVVIEAVIDETGRVRNAQVVEKLGMGLDRAATDAVLQWRFTPALYEGRPVKVLYVLTVNFNLS